MPLGVSLRSGTDHLMEPSAFPPRSPVLFALWSRPVDGCEETTVGSAKFIGPASTEVLGPANAIASRIVGPFMDIPF